MAQRDIGTVQAAAAALYAKGIELKKYAGGGRLLQFIRKNKVLLLLDEPRHLSRRLHSEMSKYRCTPEYFRLAERMTEAIEQCITAVKRGSGDACRFMMRFHNLPRAFLPADHPMHLSCEEAMRHGGL